MSQQWQSPRPGGVGSVRAARERAEAGLAPGTSQSKPSQIPRLPMQQPRQRPQAPPGFSGSRNEQGQVGIAISRPTQVPQWPLGGAIGNNGRINEYQPPEGKGRPQRPPRPSHVPSILDASRLQEHTPAFQYQDIRSPELQIQDDHIVSPNVVSPSTSSSRPSTVSSVGTIPDFPVPAIPQIQPGRRSANLGPPPSARRGASSYYSQASYVSPIPEESPRPSHLSYASSAAMPSHWGPESPLSPGFRSDDLDEYYGKDQGIEEGRESRGSHDDSDDRGLIRSASLGKRAKPSMVNTKSFDKSDAAMSGEIPKPLQIQTTKPKIEQMEVIEPDGVGAKQRQTVWPMIEPACSMPKQSPRDTQDSSPRHIVRPIVGDPNSPLATGTGLIDKTPSSSDDSVPTLSRLNPTSDVNANSILGAYNAASGLNPGPGSSRTSSPGTFSRLSAIRRPPRLNMDAVRDAESRGSLTSLPDLIARATKLAAMMDRGKRPGSRMGLNDFPSDITLSSRNKEFSPGNRNSGLSGMLAAFPPPGLATPREGTPRPQSEWPVAGLSQEKDQRVKRKQGRRCCGMPRWAFLFLILGFVIVIAAAVVIPLYFLVIRKDNSTTQISPLQQCQRNPETSCQNGGAASLSTGICSCICTNGFTGSTCTTRDQGACTTLTLRDSSVSNVTLGDSVARLITSAQSNFSIPLSEQNVVSRLNAANLSCVGQNALVTLNGRARRVGAASAIVEPASTIIPPVQTNPQVRRQATPTAPEQPVATTDGGILYDPSQLSTTPSSETTTTVAGADTLNITEEVLDFSRTVVLYILQEQNLDTAITAQSILQRFFSLPSPTNRAAENVTLGNRNVANLLNFKVNIGKGIVGGRNDTRIVGRRSSLIWRRWHRLLLSGD